LNGRQVILEKLDTLIFSGQNAASYTFCLAPIVVFGSLTQLLRLKPLLALGQSEKRALALAQVEHALCWGD